MKNIFLNRETKISNLILLAILTIFLIIQLFFISTYYNSQKQQYINIMGSVIYKVDKIDPELRMEVMTSISKEISKEEKEKGIEILKEYGIKSDIENNVFPNLINLNKIIVLSFVLFLTLISFNNIQLKLFFVKIRKITAASNKILDEDYSLLINEEKEGEFSKLGVAFGDIRRIIKNNLETTKKEKENLVVFLQNISHQIKTRIATMMIYNDILLNRNLSEEERKDFLKENETQLTKMNEIIQNILKLAKLDANTINFNKKENDLNLTLEESVSSLKPLAKDLNIKLSIKLSDKMDMLYDKFWLNEAFTNIIKNCIDHTEALGEVNVELIKTPIYYKVIIRDTGEGISQEEIPKIFERFHSAKNSKKLDSVGIGLSISKSIIELHNGFIDIKSELGKGSEFLVTFIL
ncbi:MAG: sensor histidine kinase [Clostridium chrysemydis]|uniref:sensor histidine kinase n=1 Tax=Clostridium chrysemydis TaxID=2665504 RepID=UPI003F3BA9E6